MEETQNIDDGNRSETVLSPTSDHAHDFENDEQNRATSASSTVRPPLFADTDASDDANPTVPVAVVPQYVDDADVNPLRSIRRKENKLRNMAHIKQEELARKRQEATAAHRDYQDMMHMISQPKIEADNALRNSQAMVNKASYFIPTLVDLCARTIAFHFEEHPTFSNLSESLISRVVPYISPELSAAITAPVVNDDEYWKRCALKKYPVGELHSHDAPNVSYKQIFLEREVETLLERDRPTDPNLVLLQLRKMAAYAAPHVSRLTARQLRSHLNLKELMKLFPRLSQLSISYGVRTEGMGFDMSMMGMRQTDALFLADVLKTCPQLQELSLSECMIDDMLLRGIISGLVRNNTLRQLDLSHNRISDNGAQALATLLANNKSIQHLSVANNQLTGLAGQLFAQALRQNSALLSLDLRLNRLGEEGGTALFDGLVGNATLQTLRVSSNNLGHETVLAAQLAISQAHSAISSIDFSDNPLGHESSVAVREMVLNNSKIKHFDVRLTHVGLDLQQEIEEVLRKRTFTSKYVHKGAKVGK
jgi:hypothetical protein